MEREKSQVIFVQSLKGFDDIVVQIQLKGKKKQQRKAVPIEQHK